MEYVFPALIHRYWAVLLQMLLRFWVLLYFFCIWPRGNLYLIFLVYLIICICIWFIIFVFEGKMAKYLFEIFLFIFVSTVYPKKDAHGFCFAVLCCGYILTDFPISIRLTSLALWQSNDCPSASKATLMNMDKYFMWIHYERLHNHNKAKHNKTVCIFLGIYCT